MRDMGRGGGQVDRTDEVVVRDFVAFSQAACNLGVAETLGRDDFDDADEANAKAYKVIEETLSEQTAAFVKTVLQELEAQGSGISHARVNEEIARDLEARTMSRSSTARNHGVSIDPNSRALSELQSQLSL